MSSYSNETPFDASMLVHFRKKISVSLVNKVNQVMVKKMLGTASSIGSEEEIEGKEIEGKEISESATPAAEPPLTKKEGEPKNRGKLILDATCAPADISYPTDLELLNQARKHTEQIIDSLYEQIKGQLEKKTRTYRDIARRDYLEVAKRRRVSQKERRKAIKKQLQYIKINLSYIDQLLLSGATLESLSNRQYKMLVVVAEVYRQQLWLYENKKQSIDDRIATASTMKEVLEVLRKLDTASQNCVDGMPEAHTLSLLECG